MLVCITWLIVEEKNCTKHHLWVLFHLIIFLLCTGFDPVERLVVDQPANLGNVRSLMHQVESLRELITTEPYLVLGVLFICLKLVLSVLPVVYSHLKALWVSHGWHLNLPILCEPSQLLVRVLHGIDVNKLWSKVKLGNKTMNLRKGANNARAWASTLTSVSLGESSSPSSSSSSRLITPCDSWLFSCVLWRKPKRGGCFCNLRSLCHLLFSINVNVVCASFEDWVMGRKVSCKILSVTSLLCIGYVYTVSLLLILWNIFIRYDSGLGIHEI